MPIHSSTRYRFTATVISDAPVEHGVYALWQNDELIYYGRALGGGVTIRSRLRAHLGGDIYPCTARATHYSWETSRNPVRRELDLMGEHLASFTELSEELREVRRRLVALQENYSTLKERSIRFQRSAAAAMHSPGRLIRVMGFPDNLPAAAPYPTAQSFSCLTRRSRCRHLKPRDG
jgi:hypothetical protein